MYFPSEEQFRLESELWERAAAVSKQTVAFTPNQNLVSLTRTMMPESQTDASRSRSPSRWRLVVKIGCSLDIYQSHSAGSSSAPATSIW